MGVGAGELRFHPGSSAPADGHAELAARNPPAAVEGVCGERPLAVRDLLQKSPAVVRVECRGAQPGKRERKGAKGDRPEALAAVAHRWWPP